MQLSSSALLIAVAHGERAAKSAITAAASMFARLQGENSEALRLATDSYEIAVDDDAPWYMGLALNNKTHAHIARVETVEARSSATRSLELFNGVGDLRAVGWAMTTLAQIELLEGHHEQALTTAVEAIGVSTGAFDGRNATWASELAA